MEGRLGTNKLVVIASGKVGSFSKHASVVSEFTSSFWWIFADCSEHFVIIITDINIKMEENVNFDNEVLAYLSVRKDELITSHSEYSLAHPEIREVLNDFISSVLLHKPVSKLNLKQLLERYLCICEGVLPSL